MEELLKGPLPVRIFEVTAHGRIIGVCLDRRLSEAGPSSIRKKSSPQPLWICSFAQATGRISGAPLWLIPLLSPVTPDSCFSTLS